MDKDSLESAKRIADIVGNSADKASAYALIAIAEELRDLNNQLRPIAVDIKQIRTGMKFLVK